jgi:hypothetical protein
MARKSYPEQKLTAEELETGAKGQGLSEAIAKGIRKAKVVVEEPTGNGHGKHGRGDGTAGPNGGGN